MGLADSHVERGDMAQESLLQRLEDLASRVRSLEHDKKQATATIEALERAERQAAATIQAFEREEEQTAVTIQELEREKKQAAVTIQALEREVAELGAVIAQASAKVDEMLRGVRLPIRRSQGQSTRLQHQRPVSRWGSLLLTHREYRNGALAKLSVLTRAEVSAPSRLSGLPHDPSHSGAL